LPKSSSKPGGGEQTTVNWNERAWFQPGEAGNEY